MSKLKLHWQILIALLLAVLAGTLTGTDTTLFGVRFYAVFDFIGALFLNALKMLIVPLVALTVPLGVATSPAPGPAVMLSAPKLTVEVPFATRLTPVPAAVLLTVVVPNESVEVPKMF